MEPVKLLPLEIAIYEGVRAGKTIPQIRSELSTDIDSRNISGRLTWLVNNGVLNRHGSKNKSTYAAADITYIRVSKRLSVREEQQVELVDVLLDEMQEATLSEKQMQFLRANYLTMSRSALSKELGVNKLELTYIMHKLGLKQKEDKKEATTAAR